MAERQWVVDNVVNRLGALYAPPNDPFKEPEKTQAWMNEYVQAVRSVPESVLAPAIDQVVETHKARSFPSIAEIRAAIADVQREQKIHRKAPVRGQFDGTKPYGQVMQEREEAAKQPMRDWIENGLQLDRTGVSPCLLEDLVIDRWNPEIGAANITLGDMERLREKTAANEKLVADWRAGKIELKMPSVFGRRKNPYRKDANDHG